MIQTTVIVEDIKGNEWAGIATTNFSVQEDQLVTIQIYNGTYRSGHIVEIKGEIHESSRTLQPR